MRGNKPEGGTVQEVEPLGARIAAVVQLGRVSGHLAAGDPWPGHASGLSEQEYTTFDDVVRSAVRRNGWFTEAQVRHALGGLARLLDPARLEAWIAAYPSLPAERHPATVGLVLAGNIPLVGFHDLLCVLLAGHRARVKCSAQDAGLTPAVIDLLNIFLPGQQARFTFVDGPLGTVDAVIATGSNNTARYFEHYFAHLPRIIRKGRVSVAVLDGSETAEELAALGEDVFRYFGLGCRNVSKVYVPVDFDLDRLFAAFYPWKDIIQHVKYANNYDYHKALCLLDRVPLLENGFLLVREAKEPASPVAMLHVERYSDLAAVEQELAGMEDTIQCVVGHGRVPFGEGQYPGPGDYADGVDTLAFLLSLQGTNS